MLTYPLNRQYTRNLIQPYWANFCDICSEENQNRLVTVQILDPDSEEIDTFDPEPLDRISYDPFRIGNVLTITVGNKLETTYDHIVAYPKEINVFYEQSEQIFAVVITDERKAKTVIYFEEDAVVIHGNVPQIRSIISQARG